ncbi:MAG: hypothetical protein IJJ61_07360 [Clostridia bacterium]|nr:hypothetical protein [Clostridia bacterium]
MKKRVLCIIITVSIIMALFSGCNGLFNDRAYNDKTEEYSVYSNTVETVENITWPSFIIKDVFVSSDSKEASVIVSVQNNPGIAGALLRIYYDDRLTLDSAQPGNAFSDLDYMPPGKMQNPCNFSWDSESAVADEDGAVLVLHFKLPDKPLTGDSFEVRCSFRDEDVYDTNLNNVAISEAEGKIVVK